MTKVTRNQAVLWSDATTTTFGGMVPMGIGLFGGDDATIPGPGRDTLFVQDINGNPLLTLAPLTPPGGVPNKTINFIEQYSRAILRRAKAEARSIYIQDRFHRFGALDNPNIWDKMVHYGRGIVGDETVGGANIDYAGNEIRSSVPVNFEYAFEFFRPVLTAQDPPDIDVDATAVIFVDDIFSGIIAYPGPDQIGFVGTTAVAAGTAEVLVTSDGGNIWQTMSSAPFAAAQDIVDVAYRAINPKEGVRVVVANGTSAEIAYADITWGDPTTATWTVVATTGIPTALSWGAFDELLIATSSGLFQSSDRGETIGTQLSANTSITGLKYTDWPLLDDARYFAFGTGNTLLTKRVGRDDVTTLVGPTGGTTFASVEQAVDGTIYAGNGTSFWRSTDEAMTAASWTNIRDFGANFAVVGIGLAQGDPYLIQLAVDNSTPGTAQAWLAADGVSFEQIPELANDGYNALYQSLIDPNFVIIVGDSDTTEPTIQLLSNV